MNFKLGIVLVNNITPKLGYLVFIEDQLYRINKIVGESVILKGIYEKDTMVSTINELSDKYVKFIAIHDKVMYSIIHGDYTDIVDFIKEQGEKLSFDGDTLVTLLLNNYELFIKGQVIKIYCLVTVTNVVEIINLTLIDNYNLLEKQSRLFNVIQKTGKDKDTRYILQSKINDKCILNTDRDSFKIVGNHNYKSLFSTKTT